MSPKSVLRDTDRLETAKKPPWASIPYDRFLDCVHCGLCTVSCPTYLETGNENDGPRGRIHLMRAVVDGRLELTERVKRHIDLCLDCRGCETACPSGVQFGRLIEPFREDMRQLATDAGPDRAKNWFCRFVLLGLFPSSRRLRLALYPVQWLQWLGLDRLAKCVGLLKLLPLEFQKMHSLLPPLKTMSPRLPDVLPAIGQRRARVALFTGCVADAVFRETHWATARVLQANGCDVIVPRGQVCCGAIHYHNGAASRAMQFAYQNARAFNSSDVDAVVANVAGCGAMLKEYPIIASEVCPGQARLRDELAAFAERVRDVSEFLVELGLRPPTGSIPIRAAYDDACHLIHGQRVSRQPRELLSSVPGLELVPLRESDICCGAAGSYNMVERDMSDRIAQRKLVNILKSNAQAIITGNAGCLLQIQSLVRNADHAVWVAHPMDVLDLSYRRQLPPALDEHHNAKTP